MGSPARSSPQSQGSEVTERFSRKVFVGGLPPDIDEGKWCVGCLCLTVCECLAAGLPVPIMVWGGRNGRDKWTMRGVTVHL